MSKMNVQLWLSGIIEEIQENTIYFKDAKVDFKINISLYVLDIIYGNLEVGVYTLFKRLIFRIILKNNLPVVGE